MIRTFLALVLSTYVLGQDLPSSRAVDWTVAGLNDTNTVGFTYYDAIQEGILPDGVSAANAILDSLLQLNPVNGIHIHFPAGSYYFNETLTLPSHCWISGEGAEATHFIFDLGGSGHAIQATGSLVDADSSSLTLAGLKDDNYIVVNDATLFQVGDWLKIQQQDADLVFSSWAQGSVGQLVRISGISNDTIFLASQLRLSYPLNRLPKVIRVDMKRNIGLQCFSMERIDNTAPEQASVVQLRYVENAWINGLESNKTTFGHVELESVSNSKISQCYFHDAFEYGGGGRGYGVVMHFTTNECLIENNIFKHLRHSILIQAGANGNVSAFNHSLDPFWTNSNPLLAGNSAGELVLHGNYVYANLFEQNDVQNIVIDNSHGANGPYNTFLRNRASLYGIFFSDNTSPSQNFIGNEVPNTSFPYSTVNYNIVGNDQFTFGNNNKGTVAPAGTSNVLDVSYYYAIKPSFVQDYQWGKIGLPSAMNSAKVPATDRYDANEPFAGACGNEDFYANAGEILGWSIYPNPVKDQIHLSGNPGFLEYAICDIQGRTWAQGWIQGENIIDLVHLPSGLYILKLDQSMIRFIKE